MEDKGDDAWSLDAFRNVIENEVQETEAPDRFCTASEHFPLTARATSDLPMGSPKAPTALGLQFFAACHWDFR